MKRKMNQSIYFCKLLKGFFKLAQSVMPKCHRVVQNFTLVRKGFPVMNTSRFFKYNDFTMA